MFSRSSYNPFVDMSFWVACAKEALTSDKALESFRWINEMYLVVVGNTPCLQRWTS